jgi:transcription elongation factor/antiterminator RfaH
MSNNDIFNVSRWYVIHTHPKQETRVAKNLTTWKVENLSPMIRVERYDKYTSRVICQIKPLFPSYIFARFKISDMLAKIRFTRGVHSVVNFGDGPTPVADELIQVIQSRIGKEGFIEFDEEFEAGDHVRISGGPLNGLTGVFERQANDAGRVMILLQTISYQPRTLIPKQMVEKISLSAQPR